MRNRETGCTETAYLKSAEELYEVFGKLFDRVKMDPKVGRAIGNIKMVFRYR